MLEFNGQVVNGIVGQGGQIVGGIIDSNGIIVGGMIGQRGPQGETGNGIASISKTGTSGLVDTYTITYTNGDTDTFSVTNGEKGDPGAIKIIIVEELPLTGDDDTIYLVPLENPTEEGNNYAEYIYINGQWELLGKIGVHVDLTGYVKNTDYATASKAGVIKSGYYGLQVDGTNGKAYCDTYTYANYGNVENQRFISKGTLENVITGKGLTTKSYVDGLVGDINDALDAIQGESI